MKDFGAAKLRHRVHIQRRTNNQDPITGANSPGWATQYSDVPCAIHPVSVREFIQSKADQSEITARVVMRCIKDFNYSADLRLVGATAPYDGRIFNPKGWLPDTETGQTYVTAPCTEGVNEG